MGEYFARYSTQLADQISINLDNKIKIESLAKSGIGIHRTIHQLKSLKRWPQIIIYHGGSEEFSENKFKESESKKIQANFKLLKEDRIETLIILYPELSRIFYEPVDKIILNETPIAEQTLSEKSYLKRLKTELQLYELHLMDLVNQSRDRNSLIILMTTPINLNISPRETCSFTTTPELSKEIEDARTELIQRNPKNAYKKSKNLVERNIGNATLHFLHGQVSKRIGIKNEAFDHLLKASSYDCSAWRSTEVQNAIIRKIAESEKVLLFDFAKLLERDFTEDSTFFDEIYPQNLYYEKAIQQLGLVIKSILKL